MAATSHQPPACRVAFSRTVAGANVEKNKHSTHPQPVSLFNSVTVGSRQSVIYLFNQSSPISVSHHSILYFSCFKFFSTFLPSCFFISLCSPVLLYIVMNILYQKCFRNILKISTKFKSQNKVGSSLTEFCFSNFLSSYVINLSVKRSVLRWFTVLLYERNARVLQILIQYRNVVTRLTLSNGKN